jgi:uncharacterized membrane protein
METVGTSRLEAFSDGVIAIIVTIMVLELKVPDDITAPALLKLLPLFVVYGLSFLVVAIMWVNHHFLIRQVRKVHGRLLWMNMNLLFWMSLIPFGTWVLGRGHGTPLAVALYSADLTMCAVAFTLLRWELLQHHSDTPEQQAHHRQQLRKNLTTSALYAVAVFAAYGSVFASYGILVLIPALYFMPDAQGETGR